LKNYKTQLKKTTVKNFILIFLFFAFAISLHAQVSINSDGSLPQSSAMLDIKSISKGFLPPRMTSSQRDSIINPANGLEIYNLTTNSYWYYNGTQWKELIPCTFGISNILVISQTITVPEIWNNSFSELSLTLTGASIGDGVLVAPESDMNNGGNIIVSAIVSSQNQIKVKWNNVQNNKNNPTTMIYYFYIFKHTP
jgi:hypothetical protein